MKNTYRDIYLASGNITHVYDHKWTLFIAHNGKNYVMIKLCYDQNIFIVWFQNLWENMKSIRAKNVLIFYSIIVFPSLQFYIKTKRYPLSNSTVSNVFHENSLITEYQMLEFNLFPFISSSLLIERYSILHHIVFWRIRFNTPWLYQWQIYSNGGFNHKIADYVATYVCYWSLEIVKADGLHDLQERYLILDNIVC